MTLMGIRVRLHILTPLMLALAFALVGGRGLMPILIALGIHESAHLFMALKLRARVDEIELMPFGAAIRLYELWETAPRHMILIALSGPVANLSFAALVTLSLYAFPSLAPAVEALIRMNLAIGLINLLPALPLDGGRAMSALIALKIERNRAVRVGILAGRALSAALILLSAYLLITRGRLEVGLIFSGIYIYASGEREKRQSEGAALRALLLASPAPMAPAQARVIAIQCESTVYEAARAIQPGAPHLFAVMDERGELKRVISQSRVARALTQNGSAPMSSLLGEEP